MSLSDSDLQGLTAEAMVPESKSPEGMLHLPPMLPVFIEDIPRWLDVSALPAEQPCFEAAALAGTLARLHPARYKVGYRDRMPVAEWFVAWFRGLDIEIIADIEREATRRARSLIENTILASFPKSGVEPEARQVKQALDFCHARDDLESVAHMLMHVGCADRLLRELRDLDSNISRVWPTFMEVGGLEDERLHAVAEREPDRWWGYIGI